jgi:archaellum component FlaG (FlaF/FlaG flagellin family)
MSEKTIDGMARAFGLIALLGLTAIAAGCGDDNTNNPNAIDTALQARIAVAPNPLSFQETALGSVSTLTFQVLNTGDGTLRVESVEVVEGAEDSDREITPGQIWEPKFDIAKGGAAKTLSLEWRPANTKRDTAKLRFKVVNAVNAPGGVFEVDVTTPQLAPSLVAPSVVSFPRVPKNTTAKQVFYIQNAGKADLQLRRIVLTPSTTTEFGLKYPDPTNLDLEAAAESDTPKEILKPNERIPVRVSFTPETDAPTSATINVTSNDPQASNYEITLSGNAGAECIQLNVQPNTDVTSDATHRLDFGERQIGRASTSTVNIQNCSRTKKLEVTEIKFTDDAGAVFEIVQEALPEALKMGQKLVINEGDSAAFVVAFTPGDELLKKGRLELLNNDPANRTLKIDVVGRGTNNVCPIAVAEGTVLGDAGSRPATQINTLPLKTVKLTALNSRDPDGQIDAYEWNIITKPNGSTARLVSSNRIAEPSLFLDIAGQYEIELVVIDKLGTQSCDKAKVQIVAVPDEDIHVQLIWDTPADPDQSDAFGTDLDLHYMHPNATAWNRSPWDVFWQNREGDWGVLGNPDDNPSLDIDDTDGSGPENVNHDNPEANKAYAIGVHYYADNGFGASYATIRIYLQGQLRKEEKNFFLGAKDDFWLVGFVIWPSLQIDLRNQTFRGFPRR